MITESVLLKPIRASCPICNNSLDLKINPELITTAKNFPVAVSVIHCNFTIIVYIDSDFRARGVESVLKLNEKEASGQKHKIPELHDNDAFADRVY